MSNLIYIHIGKVLPNGIYDSIYQSLLISQNTKIYIILDDSLIVECKNTISNFNINLYSNLNVHLNIEYIPLSILKLPENYISLIDKLPEQTKNFRDGFWISTTSRFFYLKEFIKLFNLTDCIHIESDVMIYEDINNIIKNKDKTKLYVVKDSDSPIRVIPSIIYIPNYIELEKMTNFFIESLKVKFFNDMELIGMYSVNNHVKFFPFDFTETGSEIYDSCAIGQYLGGIDPRNINKDVTELNIFNNPTNNFINETCTFKVNTVDIITKNMYVNKVNIPINLFYAKQEYENAINLKKINNLHIHSKQLYQFSSVFNIKYNDIISGDRILSLCDFVLTTNQIFDFHKNLTDFVDINKVIIINDFSLLNIDAFNSHINIKPIIKLFIYTHILDSFIDFILPSLKVKCIVYLHNSDHELTNLQYSKLINAEYIEKVYSQNLNCHLDKKFRLLPIGIANSMWNHGNILQLYKIMSTTYNLSKTKNLYININPNTFTYRKDVLDQIENRKSDFNISKETLPFKEYLQELSTHRFCLCIRGNGLSTHREIESLYLNVIPVIINNKYTNMNNYIRYFKKLNLPFCEINDDNLDRYTDDFFNEDLYKKMIQLNGSSISNCSSLKLSYYSGSDKIDIV